MTPGTTIVANATPAGVGGIGVLRLSGPQAVSITQALLEPAQRDLRPRQAHYRRLRDGDGQILDDGLVLYFPAPASYTGEDVVELQVHGSPVVLHQLLETCVRLGACLAGPGEFTLRAYLNGRLDLAQAEAVNDLIHAQTVTAARLARNSLDGALAQTLAPIADAIMDLRVWMEADLDFGETDLDASLLPRLMAQAGALAERVEQLITQLAPTRHYHTGLRLALVGAPNVGKSSLLNRLANDELAIVTDQPGTTRDVIRTTISLQGVPIEVMDTAGLRASADHIESLGMARTEAVAAAADLMVEVRDVTRPEARPLPWRQPETVAAIPVLCVWNKADALANAAGVAPPWLESTEPPLLISAHTGAGLDALKQAILQTMGLQPEQPQRFSVRLRHVQALRQVLAHLQACSLDYPPEIMAEELRLAQQAMDALFGRTDTEALLGAIFAGFCIGK